MAWPHVFGNLVNIPFSYLDDNFNVAARNGANSDITSLGALTSIPTPIQNALGLRNRLHNGNFGINQRGVSGTVTLGAGVYGHDRWKAGAGGCTYTFSTTNNVTTLTISAGTLQQVIEGQNLNSGTFALSWIGSAQGRIDSGVYGATGITGTAVGGTNQTVEFNTGTLSLVQYEYGAIATQFEQRPIGIELELCQRYLPAFNGIGSICFGFWYSTTQGQAVFPFMVAPRVAPTNISVTSVGNITANNPGINNVSLTALTYSTASTIAALLNFTVSSGGPATPGVASHLDAPSSAQILFTGCEL